MAALLPKTWMQTWVRASTWVGLTLPGMIEEPGSFSGSDSSPRPERGPEASRRMSLAILNRLAATVLRAPWAKTMASWAASASNLLGAEVNFMPVKAAIRSANASAKPTGALRPVPTAVPPWASSISRGMRLLDTLDAVLDLLGVAGKLLAEGEGRGVLGVGAADLDDLGERLRLVVERVPELLQGRDQAVVDFLGGGDVHGRRERVVRRLAHVHLVVRVAQRLGAEAAAEDFDRAVGDDLVGVHVGLGARAGLPDDQREMIVELALGDLLSGPDDGGADLGVELAEVHVDLGGGALDEPEGADDRRWLPLPADREVFQRALRLGAPVAVGRDSDFAEGVGLDAGRRLFAGHGAMLLSGRKRAVFSPPRP